MGKFHKHIEYESYLSINDQYAIVVTCEKTMTGIEKITGEARDLFENSTIECPTWYPCPSESFDDAFKSVFEEINTIKNYYEEETKKN